MIFDRNEQKQVVALLGEHGYKLQSATAADLFPRCSHVESVVCLSREKADDYIRISVQTKDLKRKETVCQEVNEDEK